MPVRLDEREALLPARGHLQPKQFILVGSIPMMDAVMLAIGFAFFALSIAYVYACDLL
jgi:hypothetical protein